MTSRIIEEIFTYSRETKTLISVTKRNDTDLAWIGYIVEFNDILFVLQHVSSLGLEDGLVIERIDNIDNFETDDNYTKAIQLLFESQNKIPQQVVKNADISSSESWQYELIKSGFDQGKLITIEVNDSDTLNYGFVLDYDDTSVQLTAIDKLGNEDGTQLFKLEDITSFTVDRVEGRKRQFLYELKKKNRSNKKRK